MRGREIVRERECARESVFERERERRGGEKGRVSERANITASFLFDRYVCVCV